MSETPEQTILKGKMSDVTEWVIVVHNGYNSCKAGLRGSLSIGYSRRHQEFARVSQSMSGCPHEFMKMKEWVSLIEANKYRNVDIIVNESVPNVAGTLEILNKLLQDRDTWFGRLHSHGVRQLRRVEAAQQVQLDEFVHL